jgi:hypothetical protein
MEMVFTKECTAAALLRTSLGRHYGWKRPTTSDSRDAGHGTRGARRPGGMPHCGAWGHHHYVARA